MLKLVLLFTIVPLLELWLLLAIGGWLGFWPTIGLTIGTALLGGYLAKREGRKVVHEWKGAVAEMRMPDEGVLSGILVLVGGITLVTPGILTDALGLLLLFPPTRRWIAERVRKGLKNRFESGQKSGAVSFQVIDIGRGVRIDDDMRGGPIDFEEMMGRVSSGSRGDVIDTEGEVVEDVEPSRRLER